MALQFDRTINLGQVLTICGVVGSVVVGLFAMRVGDMSLNALQNTEMKLQGAKLDRLNSDFTEYRGMQDRFSTEIRKSLNDLSKDLNDVRMLLPRAEERKR